MSAAGQDDQGIAASIAGRSVRIVQPYSTVPRLFNVRDADGERLAILLNIDPGRWRVVRTDLGNDAMNPTELDAESVEEAAREALRL